jgi:predicted ester cyclase
VRRGSPACYTTNDAMILEQLMTGTVIGSLPGLAGNGPRIIFRILRVFEFGNGLISRENVWLDSAAVVDQLSRR